MDGVVDQLRRQPRLPLLLWAALTMGLLWGARAWVVRAQTDEQAEQLRVLLSSVVEARRDQIRLEASHARTEVEGVAAELADAVSTLLRYPDERRGERRAQTLLRKALIRSRDGGASPRLQDYFVVNQEGVVLTSSNDGLIGRVFSGPLAGVVGEAMAGRTAVTTGSDLTPGLQKEKSAGVRTAVATPIRSTDGSTIAVLVFSRRVSLGAPERDGAGTGYGAIQTSFFDGSGQRLGDASQSKGEAPPLPAALHEERHALQGQGIRIDTTAYLGREGRQVIGAATYFPDLRVGLVAEIDFSLAFRPVERLGNTMAIVNVAAMLLLALLLLVTRYTARGFEAAAPRLSRRVVGPWIVMAVSLIATFLLWDRTSANVESSARTRFDEEVERLRGRFVDRLERDEETLRTIQAAHESLGAFDQKRWRGFVRSLPRVAESVDYVAFVENVPRRSLPAFEAAVAHDIGLPYVVYPKPSTPDSFPIRYIEPHKENLGRLGFDLGSIDSVRALAEKTRDSGELLRGYHAAGVLVPGEEPSFFALIPVYAPGPAVTTVRRRRAALRGWVVTRTRADAMLGGLLEPTEETEALALRIDLAEKTGDPAVVFERGADAFNPDVVNRYEKAVSVSAGGGLWILRFAAPEDFLSAEADRPIQVLLGGLVLSVLLFDIALILASARARALAIADLMTRKVRESETRIRAVIDQAPDGIITFDRQGLIETFNPGAERLFGCPAERARGRHVNELMPECPDFAALSGAGSEFFGSRELIGLRRDGRKFPLELTVSRMEFDGRPMFTAIVRDVSERQSAEQALRESEKRYALAAQAVNDGLWDWDLLTDRVYYSPRWKMALGYNEDELPGRPSEWMSRVHPDDLASLTQAVKDHLEGEAPQLEIEQRVRHRDGSFRWMLTRGVAVRDGQGKPVRLVGSQSDITDRKKAEKQLLHKALHDPLTGLPNRTYFLRRLEAAVSTRHREDRLFAVLFLDVDRFKVVNDSLGHTAGDHLLAAIAERLAASVCPYDVIARFGGDEFAVLLTSLADEAEARKIAERLQATLTQSFKVGDQEVFAAVSIGIAFGTGREETPVELLRNADAAMYRAKSLGKARYETFNQAMHIRAVELLKLETSLRRALERSEFEIHYQPIVSLASGRIMSCEALLRWQHPERGLMLPGTFIPIAEDTGLIIPIGEWVLREACRQVRDWEDAGLGRVPVSVNVSPRQIKSIDLFESVTAALRETGVDAQSLQIELTESGLMGNTEATAEVLRRISSFGVEILLDDFGTGYSSLTYLRRFPISCLKIDKSFASELTSNREDRAIAGAVIALAHNLGIKVIFEGVEQQEQLEFLRTQNCDQVQGRVLYPPLDRRAVSDVLREHFDGQESEPDTESLIRLSAQSTLRGSLESK